jgi:hypothetical protein
MKDIKILAIVFSILLVLTNSLQIVLGFDLLSFGQLAYLLTWFLLLPIILWRLLAYSINQISTYKLAAVLPLIIVLVGVGISFLIDPVKVDFYLYLNKREKAVALIEEKAVALIEAGQIETVEQLIRNNRNEFKVRSVQVSPKWVYDEKNEIEKPVIEYIYFTRYTIGFGDGSRGYIYSTDKNYISHFLDNGKTKKLKDHWYWR